MVDLNLQRDSLRFCKAFFEVFDARTVQRRLRERGIQAIGTRLQPEGEPAGSGCAWFLWEVEAGEIATSRVAFLLRLFADRLILEGPDPGALGRGWRLLAEALDPAAVPRVAAGDDLERFLPRRRRRSADRPETMTPEDRERVLREFYANFHVRWVEEPHAALEGRSPREAAESSDPELRRALEELLERMERVERARRERDQLSFSVEHIRVRLGLR